MNFDDLISRMDVSALETEQRSNFARWLTQRTYLRTPLSNAFQKRQELTVYISFNTRTGEVGYGQRSRSQFLPKPIKST